MLNVTMPKHLELTFSAKDSELKRGQTAVMPFYEIYLAKVLWT